MSLRFAPEPPGGSTLVRGGLARLASRPQRPAALKALDIHALTLSAPHAVYDLRADEISRGRGLETANRTGFRYIVNAESGAVAAAEIHTDNRGAASLLANVNYGPFVEATARGLSQLPSLDQVRAGAFEVRLLRFSAIAVMALWLKSDSGGADLIYPLAPAPKELQAGKVCSATDFLNAIRPIARTRTASEGANAVP